MADVSVEFGAKDTGLESTLKTIEKQLVALDAELKAGSLSFDEIKNKMREAAQAQKLHQTLGGTNDRIRALGLSAASAAPQVDRLEKEMLQAGAAAQGMGDKAKGSGMSISSMRGVIAGLGLGALGNMAKGVIDQFGRIDDLAQRFDTTAESIQRVSMAAKLGGTDIEAVAGALTKAGIAATKVITGNESLAETFNRAGINAEKFSQSDLDQKLIQISEAFQAAQGDVVKTNAIIEILGTEGGANLIPLIRNLDQLKDNMKGTAVVADDTVAKIAEAGDQLDVMGNNMKVWGANTLSALNDIFERVGSAIAGQGLKSIKDLNDEMERANAEARLAQRGVTRPEPDTAAPSKFPSLRDERAQAKDMPGPKTVEFEKKVTAELEAMRRENHEAEKARKAKEKQIAQKNADAIETAEQRVTREKTKQLELEEERARVKTAELAEKEAVLLKAEQEALAAQLETERLILEARAKGNEELVEQFKNQKRFNDLVGELMKSGEAFGPASAKAAQMVANEIKALKLEAGGGGGGRETAPTPSRGENLAGQMGEQIKEAELLKKIDPGMFNKNIQSSFDNFGKALSEGRVGAAERELNKIQGRMEKAERDQRVMEKMGAEKMPDFQKLQQEALDLQAALNGGKNKFGEWSKLQAMGSEELMETIDSLQKQTEGLEEEGAPSLGGPGGKPKEAPEGPSLMDKLSTAVEAIKTAVEKIEPKLPMQALA
jgi:hypothetical protein